MELGLQLLRASQDKSRTAEALELVNLKETSFSWNTSVDENYPIHHAAINNNVTLVQAILKRDPASLYRKNKDGKTFIELAAINKHWHLITDIVSEFDTSITDNANYGSALLSAARENESEVVKILLKAKAKTSWHSAEGNTALHWAVSHNNLQMIKDLLDAGCSRTVLNQQFQTPLQMAANLKFFVAAQLIESKIKSVSQTRVRVGSKSELVLTIKDLDYLDAIYLANSMPNSEANTGMLTLLSKYQIPKHLKQINYMKSLYNSKLSTLQISDPDAINLVSHLETFLSKMSNKVIEVTSKPSPVEPTCIAVALNEMSGYIDEALTSPQLKLNYDLKESFLALSSLFLTIISLGTANLLTGKSRYGLFSNKLETVTRLELTRGYIDLLKTQYPVTKDTLQSAVEVLDKVSQPFAPTDVVAGVVDVDESNSLVVVTEARLF